MTNSTLSKDVVDGILANWAAATADQEEEASRLPLKVLLGEAIDLAEVVDQHFATVTVNGKQRLGLDSVAGLGGVSGSTSTELRELQIAAATAQSRYLVLVQQASDAPVERADEILTELRATLGFVLTDGSNPTGEEQLERLREAYEASASHDGLALALESYAELANQYKGVLGGLAGFDTSVVDEALRVAQALRQRSADRLTGQVAQEQRDMMRLRNRLVAALSARMSEARRTIRFVFREYPDIVRKAGSEYSRNRKRRARNAPSEAPASGITGTESTLEMKTPIAR